MDERFPALALLVKHWAIRAGINDPLNGTLNRHVIFESTFSYSLILLVLHYLQCGTTPAVLPNLQELFKDRFSFDAPLDCLQLFQNLPSPPCMNEILNETIECVFSIHRPWESCSSDSSITSRTSILIEWPSPFGTHVSTPGIFLAVTQVSDRFFHRTLLVFAFSLKSRTTQGTRLAV